MDITLINPGQMGAYVAASLKRSGQRVFWLSQHRSPATRKRAEQYELEALSDIQAVMQSDAIISVCPPHAALNVATEIVSAGFEGLFVDANAISPQRSREIEALCIGQGITFVDGGIVGGPDWENETTTLYLSGKDAKSAAEWFKKGPLRVRVLGDDIGQASAIKMCYAAYTKGSTALLAAILATAESHGVRLALEERWGSDWAGFDEQARKRTQGVTAKAWRFAGEMEEISRTFSEAGVPEDFHAGAAEIYRRMTRFKGEEPLPDLEAVLKALIKKDSES